MVEHRVAVTLAALVTATLLAGCGGSGGSGSGSETAGSAESESWTYTDGSGTTVELDAVPTRIVAHARSAAALMSMGIRPVGVYGDIPIADDPELSKLDLDGIEIVGETTGEIDLEKVLGLQPDLIVLAVARGRRGRRGRRLAGVLDPRLRLLRRGAERADRRHPSRRPGPRPVGRAARRDRGSMR